MSLTERQRELLDSLDDFTEGTFLSVQYAGWLISRLRAFADQGEPLKQDDVLQWARERERDARFGAFLAGVAFTVRYWDFGQPGHPL